MKSVARSVVQMRYHIVPGLPGGFEILLEVSNDAPLNDFAFEKPSRQDRTACPLCDPERRIRECRGQIAWARYSAFPTSLPPSRYFALPKRIQLLEPFAKAAVPAAEREEASGMESGPVLSREFRHDGEARRLRLRRHAGRKFRIYCEDRQRRRIIEQYL